MTTERVLVPLSESTTIRQTVGYAVRSGLENGPETLTYHLVVAVPYEAETPGGSETIAEAERLLERAAMWVREDAARTSSSVAVETEVLGTDEYLFGPKDYAECFGAYVDKHDIDRIVLDPEYYPGSSAPIIQPLERELERLGLAYDEAPVERPARHERLVSRKSSGRFLAMFSISYVFYLILGDPTYWFDLVTGAAVGLIVAITLSQVSFTAPPSLRRSPMRLVRFVIYVPYLLFEIIKANLLVSLVILRPSMPIDPRMTRVNARVGSGLPLLALANSITLTPGTLTVRANNQQLLVHTLIPDAREDLFDGALERAIRFVFYGRGSAAIASPRERGDTEILGGDDD